MNERKTEIIVGEDQFLIKKSINQILKNNFKINNPIIEIIDLENQQQFAWKNKLINSFWDNQIFVIKHIEAYLKWKKKERVIFERIVEQNSVYKILIWYGNEKSTIGKLKFTGKKHFIKKCSKITKYKFIFNFINENKIKLLNSEIMTKISEQLPNDLTVVQNNLLKIKAFYNQTQKPLQIDDLTKILNKYRQGKIFNLIEQIICHKKLNQLWKELVNISIDEQNIMFILKLLNLYAVGIISVKAHINSGMNLQQIANQMKKHIFLIHKFHKLINSTEKTWLIHILEKVEEWKFKSRFLKAKKRDIIKFFLIEIYEEK